MWIDVEKMEGNIVVKMKEAIDQSKVIVLCTTKAYENSKNCKTEFNYAYEKNKERVALKLESFTPVTELGPIVANHLYYHVTDEGTFKENMPKFCAFVSKKVGKTMKEPKKEKKEKKEKKRKE